MNRDVAREEAEPQTRHTQSARLPVSRLRFDHADSGSLTLEGKCTVLELIPLAKAIYRTSQFIEVGVGPAGRRIVGEIASVRFEGSRLRGDLFGTAAADWVLVGPRSVIMVDVRYTLKTDDGALVYVQYDGRSDGSDGQGRKPTYSAARFETADPRYAWLNTILAVGKAEFHGEELHYEWSELR